MTEQELKEIEQSYTESKLQHICVMWWRHTFPQWDGLLFAVPNGGWRGARSGAQMAYEGQVRGVADLILLLPFGGEGSLCVEMKVPRRKGRPAGVQQPAQKEWQALAEAHGNVYRVCRGLIDFISAVCGYLHLPAERYIMEALNRYPLYR